MRRMRRRIVRRTGKQFDCTGLSQQSSGGKQGVLDSDSSTTSVILNTKATRTVSRLMCVNVRSVRYDHTIDGTGPHDHPAQGRSCPISSIRLQNHSTTSLTSNNSSNNNNRATEQQITFHPTPRGPPSNLPFFGNHGRRSTSPPETPPDTRGLSLASPKANLDLAGCILSPSMT
jgi:hypothetical protein